MSDPWFFTSAPDFMNADIADLSGGLDPDIAALFDDGYADRVITAPGYDLSNPGRMTVQMAQTYLSIIDVMQQASGGQARLLTVAGDLIGGRFTQHESDTVEMFGLPDETLNDTIARASTTFLTWYQELLRQGGYDTVVAAIGDHDIGDNNWTIGTTKAYAIETFKESFGAVMVDSLGLAETWNGVSTTAPEDGPGQYDETAYLYQEQNVLFVQIDVFRFDGPTSVLNGARDVVLPMVAASQLAWLHDVLTAAELDDTVDHVILQGHAPVLGPVNISQSSGLIIEAGRESPFFQTIEGFGTNNGGKLRAYFAGEVHSTTVVTDDASGIVQISHGKAGRINPKFVTFEVTETGLRGVQSEILTIHDADLTLWAPGEDKPGALGIAEVLHETGVVELDFTGGQVSVQVSGAMDGWKGGGLKQFVGGTQDDLYSDYDYGDEGQDGVIYGLAGNDVLCGLRGDDLIYGGEGDDLLKGGQGVDSLFGGTGQDVLFGGDGYDRLEGDEGDDVLFGNRMADTVSGGDGNDTLYGGNGEDLLFGGNGEDILDGGRGSDVLIGQSSADDADGSRDIFVFYTGSASDSILGFEDGVDVLDLRAFGFGDFDTEVAVLATDQDAGLLLDFGGGDAVLIKGLLLASFDASDVVMA